MIPNAASCIHKNLHGYFCSFLPLSIFPSDIFVDTAEVFELFFKSQNL